MKCTLHTSLGPNFHPGNKQDKLLSLPESSGEGCLWSCANSSGLFSTQFHIA